MAFQSDMGERRRQPSSRDADQPYPDDLRGSFQASKSGFLCRERGQEIGSQIDRGLQASSDKRVLRAPRRSQVGVL